MVGAISVYRTIYIAFFATALLSGCQAAQNAPPAQPDDVAEPTPHRTDSRPVADPEPTGSLTLREAAALALMHNPRLAMASIERRAAAARELQASLWRNPEVDVEIESLAGSGDMSGFDGAETTVSLGQLIELGGKRAKRTQVAALDVELAEWDFEARRLDTLQQMTQAFVRVLGAQERLALAEQLRGLSAQAQAAVAQRVEAGKDSAVENLRADVVMSKSRIELRKAAQALASARQNLAAVWGARTASFDEAAGEFYIVPSVPSLSDVNEILASNPDVARWAVEHRQRRAALDLEKAQATPDITVAAGVQRFEESDDSAFIVGLALPIPLFDRNQGGIEEATANLAKARKQQQAVEIELRAELGEAWNALTAAHDEVQILRDEVLPKAEQAFEAAQQGYHEGKFDYLYVLDTQRTFFETQVQYIDAIEAYHLAKADVERLAGQALDPTPLNAEYPARGADQRGA